MDWKPRIIDYNIQLNYLESFKCDSNHPLAKIDNAKLHISNQFTESLSINTLWDGIDPLTEALRESSFNKNFKQDVKKYPTENSSEKWDHFLSSIKTKFILLQDTYKKIILVGEINKNQFSSNILESFSSLEKPNLECLSFIKKIENLEKEFLDAWNTNQRVKALRTINILTKNLAKVEKHEFYPYKFYLIVKTLKLFNDLVSERLEKKIEEFKNKLVSSETSKNWSHKISTIPELVPRIYLELTTLDTFENYYDQDFLKKNFNAFERLIKSVRGVGDPLVAIYLYVYISKFALNKSNYKKLLHQILIDILTRSQQIIKLQNLPINNYKNYMQVYQAPLEFIIQNLMINADYKLSEDIYRNLNLNLTDFETSDLFLILFNLILPYLNSSFIIDNHKFILDLIKSLIFQNSNNNFPKHQLLISLSNIFLKDQNTLNNLDESTKFSLFKNILKLIESFKEKEYILCINNWIDFALVNFNIDQIDAILNRIIQHVLSEKKFVSCNEDLIQILVKIMDSNRIDFKKFLLSVVFVRLVEMFQKESIKLLACKTVMDHLIKRKKNKNEYLQLDDLEYMSILMYINKTMHDCIDQLTIEDERKEISEIVLEFINLVDFGKNYTEQLDFYVKCRANFFNFENVFVCLIFSANKLLLNYFRSEKNDSKTFDPFLKACLAFSCITIPSIDDKFMRLKLCYNTAQIASSCGFLEQTEFFIRFALNTLLSIELNQYSKNHETYYFNYYNNLLSFLIMIPNNPEKSNFYLFKKLLKSLINIETTDKSKKIKVLLNMLNFLNTMSQKQYPYHLENIESNDTIKDEDFMKTIKDLGFLIIEKILENLKEMGEMKDIKRQSESAYECYYILLRIGTTESQWKLLYYLWQLAINDSSDIKTIKESIEFTRKQSVNLNDSSLKNFADKLEEHINKKY